MEIIVSSKYFRKTAKKAFNKGLYHFEINAETKKLKFFYNKECVNDKGECVEDIDIDLTVRNTCESFKNIVKYDQWKKLLALLKNIPLQPIVLSFDGEYNEYTIEVKGVTARF